MRMPEFGLFVHPGANWRRADTRATFAGTIRRALDRVSGAFDTVWIPDHFQLGPLGMLECWSTLSYFAALYPSLKFGTLVMAHSYRNPALLAKMAATTQYLSDGRLILGLGAGWNEAEYRSYGYDFPSNRVRVEQLEEAVQVIKHLWNGAPTTFAGHYHAVSEARCDPEPSPPPPLLIAGKKPRMLRLAAQHADWWNADFVDATQYRVLTDQLARACAGAGRDPAGLRKTWLGFCVCAPTQDAAERALAGTPFEGRPSTGLAGTPDQIVAQLRPFMDVGLDQCIVVLPRFPDLSTLGLLIDDVIPQIKAQSGFYSSEHDQ